MISKPPAKKVFLVYAPAGRMVREDRCQQPIEDLIVTPLLPPTDLMYMAAVAESIGCVCKIKDYSADHEGIDVFINDVSEFQPDYLVINAATPTLQDDLAVCEIAKKTKPTIITIAKGAHFLTYNQSVLEAFPSLDFIIRGEPELTLKELLEDSSESSITGLTWRNRNTGESINNPDRRFNADLDSLPYPARHLVDNRRFIRPDNGKLQAVIKVSRGCPYDCSFCLATVVSGKTVRTRSPQNILGEIRECIEKYNIYNFLFWSDLFDLNKKWAADLCRAIIESGLRVTWASNTRADTIDEELAALMYRSGCRLVSIGTESGSQEILNQVGKKTTLDQIRKTAKLLRKSGIRTYNYFIIGLPWETEETVEETIRFAIELDCDYASFFTAVPFPGSRLHEYVVKNNLLDKEHESVHKKAYYQPVTRGHYLTKERIFELHRSAVKRFYLRPRYILKSALRIRSYHEFRNHVRAALSIISRG